MLKYVHTNIPNQEIINTNNYEGSEIDEAQISSHHGRNKK